MCCSRKKGGGGHENWLPPSYDPLHPLITSPFQSHDPPSLPVSVALDEECRGMLSCSSMRVVQNATGDAERGRFLYVTRYLHPRYQEPRP